MLKELLNKTYEKFGSVKIFTHNKPQTVSARRKDDGCPKSDAYDSLLRSLGAAIYHLAQEHTIVIGPIQREKDPYSMETVFHTRVLQLEHDTIYLKAPKSRLFDAVDAVNALSGVSTDGIANFVEYQEAAMRTKMRDRSVKDLLHEGVYGLIGEAGEVIDHLKKHLFHEHSLDTEYVKRELGDVLWYITLIADSCNLTLWEIAEGNISKLKQRYPDGFSQERSVNRLDK